MQAPRVDPFLNAEPFSRVVAPTKLGRSPAWLVAFVVFEFACQLALLSDFGSSLRLSVRVGAFAASLGLLVFFRGSRTRHPAAAPIAIAFLILCVSILSPLTSSAVGGVACTTLYLAIFAPIFWVPQIAVDRGALRAVFLALWLCYAASASVGALQVYFPGQFQPALASIYEASGGLQSFQIELANGQSIFRPMGLTDAPGGAGFAGFYAVLLGIGFLLDQPRQWFRLMIFSGMLVGMFALYLCQVRSLAVMLAICMLTIGVLLAIEGRVRKLAVSVVAVAAIAGIAFSLATSAGGDTVMDRLGSLFAADPGEVYYANRGKFLEHTIDELLPRYPLGAGLGRWGVVSSYFADWSNPDSAPIWVEIQWTGWLLDGGVPLILAYVAAIVSTLWYALQVARRRIGQDVDGLWLWGIVLFAYDIGASALTFNYPLFMGTMGLEFWLLNAVLFAAAQGPSKAGTR